MQRPLFGKLEALPSNGKPIEVLGESTISGSDYCKQKRANSKSAKEGLWHTSVTSVGSLI